MLQTEVYLGKRVSVCGDWNDYTPVAGCEQWQSTMEATTPPAVVTTCGRKLGLPLVDGSDVLAGDDKRAHVVSGMGGFNENKVLEHKPRFVIA